MNIIITNQAADSTIDLEHQFVTIGPNCWGIGPTAELSSKHAKLNKPSGYRGHFLTFVAPKDGFQIDPCDGSILYSSRHDVTQCKFCSIGRGIKINVQ